jgi:histone chaperone ASF1
MVGPVVSGVHRFVFQGPAPDHARIQNSDLIGVTVILLTCMFDFSAFTCCSQAYFHMCFLGSYNDQEFVRIGYYVNNEYSIPFDPENPPNPVDVNHLYRNILADQPRVTRFAIHWTAAEAAAAAAAAASSPAAVADGAIDAEDEMYDENMDEDDDEESDEEDETEDANAEIDIEAEESTSGQEEDEDEDGSGEGEEDAENDFQAENIIMCEDSMDVLQMQQIGMEASMSAHSNFA